MEEIIRSRRGQGLVELALLLPFLLWLLSGIVDYGRVYYYDIVAINAARSGARIAADISKQDSHVIAAVQNDASPLTIPAGNITISPSGTRATGTDATVSVTYSFSPFTPMVSALFPGGHLTVTRRATMVAY